jgi:hypothetical protein
LLLKRLVQCRPERRHRRILDASAPLLADLAELARPKKGHEGQRAAILARRATYQDSEAMLANLDGWCDTWRDNLDAADYALRRKTRAALDVTVLFYPAAHEPRYRVRTDWTAVVNTSTRSGLRSRPTQRRTLYMVAGGRDCADWVLPIAFDLEGTSDEL